MPYGTPSLQEKKGKSTFRKKDASEVIDLTSDDNFSFIPLGAFSNQELYEIDLRNQTMNPRKRRKKYLIDETSWRTPSDGEVPWIINDNNENARQYKSATQRLHSEIEEFVTYLCPTDIERLWRVFAVRRVEQCIKDCYPDAEIMVFGSFNTGLYLPTSDLDIVCFIRENSPEILRKIAQLLDYHRISAERPVTIMKAVVPIIKFREYYTKFNVDISFNQSSGYTSARAMKNYLDQWPSLGKMVILVKWFLKHHGLDDPSTGGMGGFTVFCLMLSFFQTHPLIRNGTLIPENDNLGVLLIEFFELYGLNFNFFRVAIRVNDGGEYVLKDTESWTTKIPYTNICIQDPSDPDNDIARSTKNTEIIFSHFEKAFQRLVVRVGNLDRKYRSRDNEMIAGLNEKSILSSIFFIPRKVIELRRELHHLYADNQKLANNYGSPEIIPPSFSHILYNFQYQIECAERIKSEKASKLSYKTGTYITNPIKSKKDYLDLAYKYRNEADTYREFPYENSTFLQATYGETYKKVFDYSNTEVETKTKNRSRSRNKNNKNEKKFVAEKFVAESSRSGSYERNTYKYGKSPSSRGYDRHEVESEIIYLEHDSDEYEDAYYDQPTPKRRRKGGKRRN